MAAIEREQLQASRLELAVVDMRGRQACAEQRFDAAADVLEGPGVDPGPRLVEGDLAVAHDEQIGAEQRSRAMQHRLQRVARLVAFGVGPSVAATRAGVDMAAAERRDQAQQVEQPFRRLARQT